MENEGIDFNNFGQELNRISSLVDDLCLLSVGWNTEQHAEFYRAAKERVIKQALNSRKYKEIEQLRKRLAELAKEI